MAIRLIKDFKNVDKYLKSLYNDFCKLKAHNNIRSKRILFFLN